MCNANLGGVAEVDPYCMAGWVGGGVLRLKLDTDFGIVGKCDLPSSSLNHDDQCNVLETVCECRWLAYVGVSNIILLG